MAYTFKYGDRPIDGLTIQRAVGRGGFGEVYFAVMDSGKQIALKYLRDNPDVELRGIAHVMNLKSPHLISIFDVRRNEHGDPFVLMEYVSGPSLRDLLVAEPEGLGPQKAAFFVNGIARGLSYLHERGIVHRDMKPGNIFYDDGYVKIGDYGLSKHIAVSKHSGQTVSVGTVHYMAPEIGSGSYTKAIDIYALGVILYEMLTGRLPFTGASMAEVLMRHLRDNPDTSSVPEPFKSVIIRAMAKDPLARYQDVNEMVDAITAVHEINESIRSFDAAALNAVQREAGMPHDADRTRTATPAVFRPIELDARAAGQLPPIPPIPDVLRTPMPERPMSRRDRRRAERAQRRRSESTGAGSSGGVSGWAHFLTLLLVWFGVSGILGIMAEDGAAFGATFLMLGGATLGAFVSHAIVIRRSPLEETYVDRIVRAVTVCLFAMPGFAASAGALPGSGFPKLIIPLAGAFLVFDWRQRFAAGAGQEVDGGKAFWHGVFGMLVASLANAHGAVLAAGIFCAANLVLVQLAAAWKPRWAFAPRPELEPPPAHAAPPNERGGFNRTVENFGRSVERVGESVEHAVNRALRAIPDRFVVRGGRDARGLHLETTCEAPGSALPPSSPVSEPAAVAEAHQPSFVGRTTNAGLAFLGKLLLLGGLVGAFLYHAPFRFESDGQTVLIENGAVYVGAVGETVLARRGQIAAPIMPLGVLIGTLMLIIARRRSGIAHLARGIVGGGLALVATVVMLGPGGQALRGLSGNSMLWPPQYPHLAQLLSLLALVGLPALVLLFWPRRRGQKTIVI